MSQGGNTKNICAHPWGERLLFALFFAGALVICHFVPYSDGDDAFFSEMAHTMPLIEYLKMRYVTWEGRMTSEAMTYVAFCLGHGFWSWANALVLTLLPAGMLRLLRVITGARGRQALWMAFYCCAGIGLLGVSVLGYGAIWITGSTFYLWSVVAGVWAAVPFADLVWGGACRRRSLAYAVPCGFVAAMGLEQITAVVIVFGFLAVAVHFYRMRKLCLPLCGVELMMAAAMAALFLSPGTGARTQMEIATWMPEFPALSVGHHIFLTVQWMLECMAKDGKMLLAALWVVLGICMWREGRRVFGGISVLMAAVALLPAFGIGGLTDLGVGVEDIAQCVHHVAVPSFLTWRQWAAFVFWAAAALWTLWLLWLQGKDLLHRSFAALLFLAGLASDGVMYFSPTMYASGARVHFVQQVLWWFLLCFLMSSEGARREGKGCALIFAALLLALGGLNVVSGAAVILGYF